MDPISLKKFNEIYDNTYQHLLKFMICNCSNIEDVNDLIQDVYLEVYRSILRNKEIQDYDKYMIGIARNKLKKHYCLFYKFQTRSLFSVKEDNIELIDTIEDDIDIEKIVLKSDDLDRIWSYLKEKKIVIQRIFYLYYEMDFTIREIAQELDLKESYIKNGLYRTLKELQEILGRDEK